MNLNPFFPIPLALLFDPAGLNRERLCVERLERGGKEEKR